MAPALALLACGETSAPTGPRVAIGVAPLTLPGLTNACYSIAVTNGATDPVWSRSGICANIFGDSQGSISYVGPCDASDGVTSNTVTLVLEDLFTADGRVDPDSYQNPCGDGSIDVDDPNYNYDGFGPCALDFTCRANADVPVAFDITVMRAANQGFFDIAVNFEDIFCSAKVDCNDATTGATNALLFNPATGQRDATAVAAFACYSGTAQTVLHMSDVHIVCPLATYVITPSEGPGNLELDASTDEILFAAAVYEGVDTQVGLGMSYWNVALGIDELALPATGCQLVVSATASETSWPTGFIPATHTKYPVMSAAVDLSIIEGNLTCGQHPLNGENSQLVTAYIAGGIYTGITYCNELVPGATDLTSTLPDCGVTNVFIGDAGGTAFLNVDGNFYSATAPPDAFVDGNGDPVTGTIAMIVTNDGFNGSYGVGGSDDIDPTLIADFTFVDEEGNTVQVAPNTFVTIRIPLPASSLYVVGESVDFYAYNAATTTWELTATGVVVVDAGQLYAQAAVPHFTWYGVQPAKQSCVDVTLTDANGDPVSDIVVRSVVVPASGGAFYAAATGPDGTVCLKTRALNGYRASIQMPGLPAGTVVTPPLPFATAPFTSVATCGGACLPLNFQVVLPSSCDGVFVLGEQCDGGDNCTADCTCEDGTIPLGDGSCTFCGNGNLDADEECDPLIGSGDFCNAETCGCETGYYADGGECFVDLDGFCTAVDDPDCDGVCIFGEEGGPDCNEVCDPGDENGPDCDGLCTSADEGGPDCDGVCGAEEGGSPDCNGICETTDSDGPDCDGVCQPDDEELSADCNNVCAEGEDGSGDCNGSCDNDETGSPDCDALCQPTDYGFGPDCDFVCQPGEEGSGDCNMVCTFGEDGSSDCDGLCRGDDTSDGPDCDGTCNVDEDGVDCNDMCEAGEAGSSDCDSICAFGEEGSSDCDGVCLAAEAGTVDCDFNCAIGEEGSTDCDGVCADGEEGSTDCNGVCASGEEGSADCNGVCAVGEEGSTDCNGACELGEDGSVDCDGLCRGDDTSDGPDCNGTCQVDEDGVDCNNTCEAGEAGSIDCDSICAFGEEDSSDCDGVCVTAEAGTVDCDNVCGPNDGGSPDCNALCEAHEGGSPDCDGSCNFEEGGSPDCDGVCGSTDVQFGPDCDTVCTVAEHGTLDCDGLCAAGEGGTDDCDGICDIGEHGSTDCDGLCQLGDSAQDCNGTCEVGEELGTTDCDGICTVAEHGSVDCNGVCAWGEEGTDDCDTVCTVAEHDSHDCDGICKDGEQGTNDCNGVCALGEEGTDDCDGFCVAAEHGTADCNDICQPGETFYLECDALCEAGEAGSIDCDGTCSPAEDVLGNSPDCLVPCSPAMSGTSACNGVCDLADAQYDFGGPDCNGACEPGEDGTGDCNGICDGSDAVGSVDCNGVCDTMDHPATPDCNGVCNLGDDAASVDCNGVCAPGDIAGSPDCNGVCDGSDLANSADCNGTCDADDSYLGPDCNQVCEPGDSAFTYEGDCNGACQLGEDGSTDCDGVCGLNDTLAGPDCNGVCDVGDIADSVDCTGTCDADELVGSADCNGFCNPGDEVGSPDCNGLCDNSPDEGGSVDCNGTCEPGEQSPDCNGICEFGDSGPDCNGTCEPGEALTSSDCNGICDGFESYDGPNGTSVDCDGVCDAYENTDDCNGICEYDEGGTADCNGICEPGEDNSGVDCDTICDVGEAFSFDCDGNCSGDDHPDSADCLPVVDEDVGGIAQVLTPAGTFAAVVPANAFVDVNDEPVTGDIVMSVTSAPSVGGNYGISGGGTLDPETIADIHFTDAYWAPVQVASGSSITVTMPLPATTTYQVGDTVSIYYYEAVNQHWVVETTGTVVVHGPGLGVSFVATHFSIYAVAGSAPSLHSHVAGNEQFGSLCFLTRDGGLECPGYRDLGLHEPPPGIGYVSVVATEIHACALHGSGAIDCWGLDFHGQASPPSHDDFIDLATSAYHGCGVREGGFIACWGDDEVGQVSGAPTTGGFTDVAVGSNLSCALDGVGAVTCWGAVDPSFLPGVSGLTQLAIDLDGSLLCAVDGGAIDCWGPNHGNIAIPAGETQVHNLRMGYYNIIALRGDGTLGYWAGDSDYWASRAAPTDSGWVAIGNAGCALREDGSSLCWTHGYSTSTMRRNDGNGIAVALPFPERLIMRTDGSIEAVHISASEKPPPGPGYKAVVTDGGEHICAIGPSDQILCWGDTTNSAPLASPSGTFVAIAGANGDLQIVQPRPYYLGTFCAISTTGAISCWGNPLPQNPNPPTTGVWTAIWGHEEGFCAKRSTGTITCWGFNSFDRTPPTAQQSSIVKLAENCALRDDQAIACWHFGPNGSALPVAPSGNDFIDIAKGDGNDWCALRSNGELACWGIDHARNRPYGSGFVALFGTKRSGICGVRADGTASCGGSSDANAFEIYP